MKDTKIQWHPGFVSAMNLELEKNRDDLIFEKEYNLNTKPLEVDLLVIKKRENVNIDNEVGRSFKGHNIMEYKCPGDSLDIDIFYKVQSYAGLYKSYGKTVDAIRADDVTVSLFRDAKPKGLFSYLEDHGYIIDNPYHGIYHIKGFLFLTQIIVIEELKWSEHKWLGALSDKLQKQKVKELIKNVGSIKVKQDREYAESVLEICLQANLQIVKELMQGDDSVNEALLEVMSPLIEPQILLRERKAKNEGEQKGIQGTVNILRNLQYSDAEIKEKIMQEFSISRKEAEEYLKGINKK